jgi:hypothetical protein
VISISYVPSRTQIEALWPLSAAREVRQIYPLHPNEDTQDNRDNRDMNTRDFSRLCRRPTHNRSMIRRMEEVHQNPPQRTPRFLTGSPARTRYAVAERFSGPNSAAGCSIINGHGRGADDPPRGTDATCTVSSRTRCVRRIASSARSSHLSRSPNSYSPRSSGGRGGEGGRTDVVEAGPCLRHSQVAAPRAAGPGGGRTEGAAAGRRFPAAVPDA